MKEDYKFIRRHVAVAKQLRKCPVDRKKQVLLVSDQEVLSYQT